MHQKNQKRKKSKPAQLIKLISYKLESLLRPEPYGKMDINDSINAKNIIDLIQTFRCYSDELVRLKSYKSVHYQIFNYIFNIVEYYGFQKPDPSTKYAVYLFANDLISINGLFYDYIRINSCGIKIFHEIFSYLNDKFYLYHNLLPDLNDKINEIAQISKEIANPMLIKMTICQFLSTITRIVLNYKTQIINENQTNYIDNLMEKFVNLIRKYLKMTSFKDLVKNGLLDIIGEIIHRIKVSKDIFSDDCLNIPEIQILIPIIEQERQIGRTSLRVAILDTEFHLQKILISLKCFQLRNVDDLCGLTLLKLIKYEYFTNPHVGVGALCFTGFSMKLVEVANQILDIIDEFQIIDLHGGIQTAEAVATLFIHFFNVPIKRYWDGYWYKVNIRTIKLINQLGALPNSNTISKIFR